MTEYYNHGKCPECRRPVWGDPDLECSRCGWREHDEPECSGCGDTLDEDDAHELNDGWYCQSCYEERQAEAQRDDEGDRKYEDLRDEGAIRR